MKTNHIILLIMLSILMFACQKVVTIDLNSANKIPVIQANVTNQPGPYTVQLNNTANYYDANTFSEIEGASLTISDGAGTTDVLHEVSSGLYQTSALIGVPGRTYQLTVSTIGKTYTALSTMPLVVPIDSVAIESVEGGNEGKRILCYFKDPPGIGNYYRLRLSSSDTAAVNPNSIRISSDNLTNGDEMRMSFRTDLHVNDTVTVNLESIDKITYDFYKTLPDAQGGDNQFLSALPANPTNNISNGGLGYFSAYSINAKTVVIH